MKFKSEVVSFRCPVETAHQMDTARKPFNISRGEWARIAVMAQIQHGDPRLLAEGIDDLSRQLKQVVENQRVMNLNLSKATYLLLTNSDLDSPEAAGLIASILSSLEGGT